MKQIGTSTIIALLLAGCSVSSRFTQRTQGPVEVTPQQGKAAVVFMNTGKAGSGIPYYLIDEKRNFLGESIGFSRIVAQIDPGKHVFYAVNKKDGSKVEADLAPDKTYFVRVRVGFGGNSVELVAFTERRDEWVNREQWLNEKTSAVTTDFSAGQAFVDKYNWVDRNMKVADDKVAEMTEDQRMTTSVLKPEDGI